MRIKTLPMAKKLSLIDHHPYPHIEVTLEAFPRFLATRSLDDSSVDYFGAFLTKTAVRILIDFLNRVFRLRSCDVHIDGSFPVPCTQYFRKRCLAPCVSALCTQSEHDEAAEALRLFLKNDRSLFLQYVNSRIAKYSESLGFERAAFYRDMLGECEKFWMNPRLNIWLNDSVDMYDAKETDGEIYIFLVTTRGRYTLGKSAVFTDLEPENFFQLLEELYQYYLPREIRVLGDFDGRKELADRLGSRFGKECRITVVGRNAVIQTAARALTRSRSDVELRIVRKRAAPTDTSRTIQASFGLNQKPKRIEAIDVAHISGTGLVGAASVWSDGRFSKNDYGFSMSRSTGEVSAIGEFVIERFKDKSIVPDLLLIDGGKSQLNSALKAASSLAEKPEIISAVKPKGKHSQISHFLLENGGRIEFDSNNTGHLLLQRLRDDAHELANYVHAEYRDARHFYEANGTQPLVVPIRFTSTDGTADDLRPIPARIRSGGTKTKQTRPGSRGLYRPLKRAR
jgi:excinuclease ABC subunit C